MSRDISPTDDLLVRAANGDKNAFAEFYDDTSRRVFAIVLRVLRDPAQSEEVTQDVYLEVWQTAARYEPTQAGAVGWILTIAHRRAIDRVRSSQSSRERDMRIGMRDREHDYDHVSEEVEVRSEFDRAKRALEALTPLQREVVTLVYFDGYSQAELAEQMQLPIGTVKTRLRDGLIRMRAEMTLAS